ncbi:unnamed protein product [Vitrella brassicaformis CCMP3155]|uniref:Uncharacterized protein n=1 Tax=Vitrella brassicaformis (strain CCMP3155) TaxID=1169540 RepID=A0A0G4F3U9_VITBC|nr:unnamed protein product [Vitrella brassicaformis CCMP3155]|eukprot:CEM06600.1 unnamed protein product [Vitrella brassicaformis CCMP3155]
MDLHVFVPPFGHQTTLTSRRALRTAAGKSVPTATVTSAPVPSKQPDGVPPGTPVGDVYGRGAEEVRQGLPALPRITLLDEFVNRHTLPGMIEDYLDSDLKQQNQLTVSYYVWPLLMQMQLQTDCRVRAKPYDQDNIKATSVSFLIEKDKDGRLIAEYPRKLWVLVGDDSDVKPEEALRLRLEKQQTLRYGCAVDTFRRWHFYKYDNKTYDKAGELVHVKTLKLEDESQAIVDSIMELLHRDDTRLPLQQWDDALYHNFDEDDEEA